MKWEHIITEVFMLYLKFLGLYLAYALAKYCTAQKRSSTNPSWFEKVFRYAACIGVVSIIGFLASGLASGNDEIDEFACGAIVFLALLIPALFGVADGFTTTNRNYNERPPRSDTHL